VVLRGTWLKTSRHQALDGDSRASGQRGQLVSTVHAAGLLRLHIVSCCCATDCVEARPTAEEGKLCSEQVRTTVKKERLLVGGVWNAHLRMWAESECMRR
jgi:hypothetical protein